MRTVLWKAEGPAVRLIDQRLLPGEVTMIDLHSVEEVAQAIRDMAVRGAPAIGATAAYGLALAAALSPATDLPGLWKDIEFGPRPSGCRAAHCLQLSLGAGADDRARAGCRAPGPHGHVPTPGRGGAAHRGRRRGDQQSHWALRSRTHPGGGYRHPSLQHGCAGDRRLRDRARGHPHGARAGKRVHVLVDETRPRLQGARLTAWELEQYGIPYEVITDGAAGYFLSRGQVAACLVGADRVAANGDVANKIGTYMLALAANDNEVPFYVVVPTSTVDLSLPTGAEIPIEERDPGEVLHLEQGGKAISPAGSRARNPAFDITPHRLVTAFVTEVGVLRTPFAETLAEAVRQARQRIEAPH